MSVLLALAVGLFSTGCVRRRMTIRTNPPGALVYVDDYRVGTTPISTDFTYYGKRKIRLVKDGFETLTVMQPVRPPWYQFVPLDFVAENLIPGKITDRQTFDYQLTPQMVVPPEQLLSRAENLRRGAHAAGATAPIGPPGVRVNPPATGPELIPTPSGVGGQHVYPLPPSSRR